MEKRLFLAIGLSMLVVWLWSAGTPKSIPPSPSPENLELTQNKEVEQHSDNLATKTLESSVVESPAQKAPVTENIEQIESDKLNLQISNIGGMIKKIEIKEYGASLPLTNIGGLLGYDHLPFTLQKDKKNSIRCVYENQDLRIVKSYEINNDYSVNYKVELQNKTDMSKQVIIKANDYTIEMSSLDNKSDGLDRSKIRDRSLNEYVINSENGIFRKGGAYKFSEKEAKEKTGKVFWAGFRNRYFCLLIKPDYPTSGYEIKPKNETSLSAIITSDKTNIPAKGNVQFDSIIYAGPEKIEALKEYGLGFEKIRRYYRFSLFDGIAKIIASLMRLIHKVVPNWGVCILIISVIIYFSMYPLTMRGMLSMKRMQALQPEIMKIKEKYKDKPEKMNKEMMELYKEHKVNPLGGCLPMLLQMPVFIGLYQVLWRSVSFKGAHFLWIKDLSEPDRLFIFPFSLPIIGNELNILPLIMVLVMFFQQKLTAKNMVLSDPSQAAQQKMMAIIMPIFLGFIFYKFASGLTLYFTMFYFFSTFTQWKMAKSTKTG